MTPFASIDSLEPVDVVQFSDFEVSWIGDGPTTDLLCFGSEDGRLRFVHAKNLEAVSSTLALESNEAINGAAFYGRFGAVSTRGETIQFQLSAARDAVVSQAACPYGAHGLIAAGAEHFVAPIGPNGLLVWESGIDAVKPPINLCPNHDDPYNFYRVIGFNDAGRSELLLVSATRHGGVAATTFIPGNGIAKTCSFTFPGLDVIDVCALGSGGGLAVAALGVDCTLAFSRHVQNDRQPISFKINGIEGTAYNLFSAAGHLFLLTSRGLYVLKGLARRFLEGERIERQSTEVSEIPLEAVDANLIGDQRLAIIMTDHTLLYDVQQWAERTANGKANGMSNEVVPSSFRTDSEIRETMLPAADAA